MIIQQQKRYWNLNIYLKTLFILYLIDLFTLLFPVQKVVPRPELDFWLQDCHCWIAKSLLYIKARHYIPESLTANWNIFS